MEQRAPNLAGVRGHSSTLVIIPAFNEEAYLPATLAAVRDAADGLPCDVIVVDNESTDRTREIALAHQPVELAIGMRR